MPAIALAIRQTIGRRRKITRTELAHLLATLARSTGLMLADPAQPCTGEGLPMACGLWANRCTGCNGLLIDPPAIALVDVPTFVCEQKAALMVAPDTVRPRHSGRVLLLHDGKPLTLPH